MIYWLRSIYIYITDALKSLKRISAENIFQFVMFKILVRKEQKNKWTSLTNTGQDIKFITAVFV